MSIAFDYEAGLFFNRQLIELLQSFSLFYKTVLTSISPILLFSIYLIVEKAWFDDIQREKLMRNRLEDVTCVLYHFFQSKVINSHPY